jgi:hypothetical protein
MTKINRIEEIKFDPGVFTVCAPVRTVEAYLALPLEQRERRVWFWPFKWYTEPYALEWGEDGIFGLFSEWDKFRAYTKKKYPVQSFIRNEIHIMFLVFRRRWLDVKYWVKNRIINPRKEMRAVVFPSRYQDLDSIIITFCLECVVEYVDREKCFDTIVWDNDEEHIQRARVIKEIYAYAKTGRKALQDKIDKEWEYIPSGGKHSLKVYEPIELLEQEMADLDTKYCTWVVSNRSYLWT